MRWAFRSISFVTGCAVGALDKYSFEAAILENAVSVGYREPVLTKLASDIIGQFIELSNRLWEFYPGPLNESTFWMSLRQDEPLDNVQMQQCRDALRAFVREHFGVRKPVDRAREHRRDDSAASCGWTKFGAKLRSAIKRLRFLSYVPREERMSKAMERMQAMYYALANRPEHYRNLIPYHSVFDHVADGINAWRK